MRGTTIFQEKNRRIIGSFKRMGNHSLLSRIYDASLYLSFREDFLIFGYILQALEELDEYIEPGNIDNLLAAIHLLLLSGYHTYNLPMYYNLDVDKVTGGETLHRYCNESIAELIIIILSRNGIKRLLQCDSIHKSSHIQLLKMFMEGKSREVDVNLYKKELSQNDRRKIIDDIVKRNIKHGFRLCFIGYEVLKGGGFPDEKSLQEIDILSTRFEELYVLTYTDLHSTCDTIQSCTLQEESFVESKNGTMEILLKRNYFNRSFQNILQFMERQFLCKIRDNMRKNTRNMS